MLNSWQNAYKELVNFIEDHPQIQIGESKFSIPDDVRVPFYRMFDMVTKSFVEEKYAVLPAGATALVERYNRTERALSERLQLQGITMTGSLETFVHDPRQGMTKALFDPLCELLQGKMDLTAFEDAAPGKLDTILNEICRLVYPHWVYLALVARCRPDAIFQVVLDPSGKPIRKEVTRIQLGCPVAHPKLRLPDFIIHATSPDNYFAIKLELDREIITFTTDNRAERKRSMNNCGNTFSVLSERTMLIYVLAGPDEIPIVADLNTRRITPPDLVVECLDGAAGGWDRVKHHYDILLPWLGTIVVSRTALPGPGLPSPLGQMHPLRVGLDPAQLEFVLDTLHSVESKVA